MSDESHASECKVCAAPNSSIHLGMDVCRACASFFKRVKSKGRKYPCRTSDRNCAAYKGGALSCRGCRFDKCVSIGLEYEGLLRVRRKSAVSLLQRIETESKASIGRRRVQELALIRKHGGHEKISNPHEELYEVHHETCNEIYRIYITESQTLFQNVFPAVASLARKEQDEILKHYVGVLAMVEGYHQTKRLWGQARRYIPCSVVTCVDMEREFDGIEQFENATLMVSLARTFSKEQQEMLLPLLERAKIDDREHYALMALAVTEQDSELSEEAQVILDRYRMQVLEELQQYYRNELLLNDFSSRMGNLMSLNHTIQECRSLFKVFMRFYTTMFDVFITENSLKEFLF